MLRWVIGNHRVRILVTGRVHESIQSQETCRRTWVECEIVTCIIIIILLHGALCRSRSMQAHWALISARPNRKHKEKLHRLPPPLNAKDTLVML